MKHVRLKQLREVAPNITPLSLMKDRGARGNRPNTPLCLIMDREIVGSAVVIPYLYKYNPQRK
jgi:hypothetical protein